MRFLCPVRFEMMLISRLHTARSLSLLTHILQWRNQVLRLEGLFTVPFQCKSCTMTSLNQEHDGKAPFSYHILTRIQTFSSQSKLSKSVQNYCNLTPPIFGLSKFNPTSTTTWCFPTVNFFPMKLLCAFSVLSREYRKITKIICTLLGKRWITSFSTG